MPNVLTLSHLKPSPVVGVVCKKSIQIVNDEAKYSSTRASLAYNLT